MARYVRLSCPNCYKTLDYSHTEKYSYSNYIGLPYIRCSKCNSILSTGWKFYSNMTEQEKKKIKSTLFAHYFSNLAIWFVVIFFICILIINMVNQIMEIGININSEDFNIYCLIFSFFASLILSFFKTKIDFNKIKKMSLDDFLEDLNSDEELKNINLKACK